MSESIIHFHSSIYIFGIHFDIIENQIKTFWFHIK